MSVDKHWLKINYRGWSDEALREHADYIHKFSGSKIELDMIEMELKRREEEANVPQ